MTKYRGYTIEGDKPTLKRIDNHHIQYAYRGYVITNCTIYHSGAYCNFQVQIAGEFYKFGTLKECLKTIDYKIKYFEKYFPNIEYYHKKTF